MWITSATYSTQSTTVGTLPVFVLWVGSTTDNLSPVMSTMSETDGTGTIGMTNGTLYTIPSQYYFAVLPRATGVVSFHASTCWVTASIVDFKVSPFTNNLSLAPPMFPERDQVEDKV
jgi:hypothetical protein